MSEHILCDINEAITRFRVKTNDFRAHTMLLGRHEMSELKALFANGPFIAGPARPDGSYEVCGWTAWPVDVPSLIKLVKDADE
jgi:hypothetical protein